MHVKTTDLCNCHILTAVERSTSLLLGGGGGRGRGGQETHPQKNPRGETIRGEEGGGWAHPRLSPPELLSPLVFFFGWFSPHPSPAPPPPNNSEVLLSTAVKM